MHCLALSCQEVANLPRCWPGAQGIQRRRWLWRSRVAVGIQVAEAHHGQRSRDEGKRASCSTWKASPCVFVAWPERLPEEMDGPCRSVKLAKKLGQKAQPSLQFRLLHPRSFLSNTGEGSLHKSCNGFRRQLRTKVGFNACRLAVRLHLQR